jgi:hypothetical protein
MIILARCAVGCWLLAVACRLLLCCPVALLTCCYLEYIKDTGEVMRCDIDHQLFIVFITDTQS